MTSNTLLAEIKAIMSEVFDTDLDEKRVTAETSAKDIEQWDSLSHIRLIVALERKFKIKFKNSEIEALTRVGDLVEAIEAKATV